MGRIKGITVTLTGKTKTGQDDFGHPIYENKEIQVENVLVVPASTEDVTNQLNLTGKKASYTLGIPKGDQNEWKDREVRFFGRKWRTIGIPLEWTKKVMVEAYE